MAKIVDPEGGAMATAARTCATPGCSPLALRRCRVCGKEKSQHDDFYMVPNPLKKLYHTRTCTSCWNDRQRAWAVANPERQKNYTDRYRAKTKYGLNLEEYREIVQAPCAICGAPSGHLDHDHATDLVRGALCGHCNRGLGYFRDDPNILEAAASYLREGGTRNR